MDRRNKRPLVYVSPTLVLRDCRFNEWSGVVDNVCLRPWSFYCFINLRFVFRVWYRKGSYTYTCVCVCEMCKKSNRDDQNSTKETDLISE